MKHPRARRRRYLRWQRVLNDCGPGERGAQDPETGCWPIGPMNISRTFAYTALYRAACRMPDRPDRVVDGMLAPQRDSGPWDDRRAGFHTMDAIYVLSRLPGRIGRRRTEAREALAAADGAIRWSFAAYQQEDIENPRLMLSIVHALGLLQEALPENFSPTPTHRFGWDRPDLYRSGAVRRP